MKQDQGRKEGEIHCSTSLLALHIFDVKRLVDHEYRFYLGINKYAELLGFPNQKF